MTQQLSLIAVGLAVIATVTLVLTKVRPSDGWGNVVRELAWGVLAFSVVALLVLWLPEITPGDDPTEPGVVPTEPGGVPPELWPPVLGLALFLIYVLAARRLLERASAPGYRVHLWKAGVGLVSLILVVLAIPNTDISGQVLTFLGLLIGAVITLSSTTVVANALAGFMLKVINNFAYGDRIRVGDYYGGVSERGLFHIEIQTEDMRLVTLPNTYMVTNPVTVVGVTDPEEERGRKKGERSRYHTWVHADVSLGYDHDPKKVARLLKDAAGNADLDEPWVRIMELGDFSVLYRVSARLCDVRGRRAENRKRIFSAPAQLRAEAMKSLHAGGVEIVSPTMMTTREFPADHQFMTHPTDRGPAMEDTVDPNVLAKADEMQRVDETHKELVAVVEAASERMKDVKDRDAKREVEETVADLAEKKKELEAVLADPDASDEPVEAELDEVESEVEEKVRELGLEEPDDPERES